MSINGTARKVKSSFLVVPNVSGMSNKEAAHAYLDAGLMPHPWRVAVKENGRTKVSCYRDFKFDEVSETHESIDGWRPDWQCGLVTSRGSGLIAIDIDRLSEFESWDFMEFPDTVQAITGHDGGHHLLFDGSQLRGKDWPTQGNIPGGQIKSNGFISVEPSIHPGGRPYRWGRMMRLVLPIGALGPELAKYRLSMNGSGGGGGVNGTGEVHRGPEKTAGLWSQVLAAGDGQQHDALRDWIWDAHMRGLEDEEILDRLQFAAEKGQIRSFSKRNPWTRAGFRALLAPKDRRPYPDARADELDGIGSVQVNPKEEKSFWESRPVLESIRGWALARRASPWATLGECLAEAICHTPPLVQLPPLVGGPGSLNMLIALVGKPGAGKGAAADTAFEAFRWKGILGLIPDEIQRVPCGSGEGIPKAYGFASKNKDTGKWEVKRTEYSSIVELAEIDSYKAIASRSGSILSPELRKFYSGEKLGSFWSDETKRVIIPKRQYRGCLIAGVQPARSDTILGDAEGGFAQRWVWLPAHDPTAPDLRPEDPPVINWSPPARLLDLDDEPYIMELCTTAREERDAARVMELRGESDDIEAHTLYTRLKVAAGLSLLDGRCDISEQDWELSGFVMQISAQTRDSCAAFLRQKEAEANISRGRAEGVRAEVAVTAQHQETMKRIGRNVVKQLPAKHGWISVSDIKNSIVSRDRALLEDVLSWLTDNGTIERIESEYHNRKNVKYRKAVR